MVLLSFKAFSLVSSILRTLIERTPKISVSMSCSSLSLYSQSSASTLALFMKLSTVSSGFCLIPEAELWLLESLTPVRHIVEASSSSYQAS